MTEKCKVCSELFLDFPLMLEHFLDAHLSKLKSIPCMYCEKVFANFEDLLHHLELDHIGMHSKLLQQATAARETKKQLGDYIDPTKKGVGMECPQCFELFSSLDKINEHAKKEHATELNPEFIKKMRKTIEATNNDSHPMCQRCHKLFLGVVFTRIDNKIQNVCLNCYEQYFGKNALSRLTIGTNDDVLDKMRKPLN